MAILKKTAIKCGKNMKKLEPSYTSCGNVKCYFGKHFDNASNAKHTVTI
jgi:hypothetical protein